MSRSRRGVIGGALALAALALGGCTRLSMSPSFQDFLLNVQGLNRRAQRLLQGRMSLAQEFSPADISPDFRANGSIAVNVSGYRAMLAEGFANYRLVVDGLVERPLSLSLDQLRGLPARTQITRHDCVEGWSSIGQWTGPRLSEVLKLAGLRPEARYLVFHCADVWQGGPGQPAIVNYYESIDLYDAFHPQTILAYAMNGKPLPEPHGAPLRLRVERQLGYKHAKYVMRIEARDSLDGVWGGKGGFWEDRGYEWYAGI
jgi:DMSO/TMAO reductase YedYZ molybdopterin-dependent catalytic subunit